MLRIQNDKRVIQEHFFRELGSVIERAAKARRKPLDQAPILEQMSKDPVNHDLDKFREDAELANEIVRQKKNLIDLTAEMDEDMACFLDRTKQILSEAESDPLDDPLWEPSDLHCLQIEEAYTQYLGNWTDALSVTRGEHMSLIIKDWQNSPEVPQMKEVEVLSKEAVEIRRASALWEIRAPLVFALVAILYVWFAALYVWLK